MAALDLSRATWRKSNRSNGGEACVEVAPAWRKSSRSGPNGGSCIEVATVWRKSSRSGDNNGNCVEVVAAGGVAVRDSKNPHGPKLGFRAGDWGAFVDRVRGGAFDG